MDACFLLRDGEEARKPRLSTMPHSFACSTTGTPRRIASCRRVTLNVERGALAPASSSAAQQACQAPRGFSPPPFAAKITCCQRAVSKLGLGKWSRRTPEVLWDRDACNERS